MGPIAARSPPAEVSRSVSLLAGSSDVQFLDQAELARQIKARIILGKPVEGHPAGFAGADMHVIETLIERHRRRIAVNNHVDLATDAFTRCSQAGEIVPSGG